MTQPGAANYDSDFYAWAMEQAALIRAGNRGASWRATIMVQRRQLQRHMADNPSLKSKLPEALADAYGDAVIAAVDETGLPDSAFPAACPWSYDRAMDNSFWPEA